MLVQFKKEIHKPSTLTCIRDDGSKTWTKMHPGIEIHDIAHFVVEKALGFKDAFYGTIAKGYNIGDFELPRDERSKDLIPSNLSVQARQVEHIVNLIQVFLFNQDAEGDILASMRNILDEKGIDFPKALGREKMLRILKRIKRLMAKWESLEAGEIIELEFKMGPERLF